MINGLVTVAVTTRLGRSDGGGRTRDLGWGVMGRNSSAAAVYSCVGGGNDLSPRWRHPSGDS